MMENGSNKRVSIIILTYNNEKDLAECIPSILDQTYKNFELLIVDNGSTDGTIAYIKTHYPEIKLIETGTNLGYAGGNNVGFQHANGDYIVVVNPDTLVDPGWLTHLIQPFDDDHRIGITNSKVLEYDDRDHGSCGNTSHYTGLHFPRGMEKSASTFTKPEIVSAISGCSFAIRKEVLSNLGGFDADYFLYLEDSDLSLRTRLAGYKILFTPESVIYHKHKTVITPQKEYYLEKNRYMLLLKCYSMKLLVMMLPALVVTEMVTWTHATMSGRKFVYSKLMAYRWVLRNAGKIIEKRSDVKASKKIPDSEFLELIEPEIPFAQVMGSRIACTIADAVINSFYKAHFRLLKKLV
jgi:GT2 family glycosyltransferase